MKLTFKNLQVNSWSQNSFNIEKLNSRMNESSTIISVKGESANMCINNFVPTPDIRLITYDKFYHVFIKLFLDY